MRQVKELAPYDAQALKEITKFKQPEQTSLGRLWDKVTAPVSQAADFVFDTSVGRAVSKAVEGIVTLLNDGASWSVRADAIYAEFRSDGHTSVKAAADVHRLRLEDVDRTVGYLATKYKALAAAEGAGAGVAGAAGLAIDVPLLVGLALRAVNEFAAYYGFETSTHHERMFAMQILAAASSPTDAAKQLALAELTRASVMVAKKKTWEELNRAVSVQAIRKIAESLGIRLTKAKLAQVIPVTGAVVGAGFNAWYVSKVTEAAYLLYRERFLLETYGPDIIHSR